MTQDEPVVELTKQDMLTQRKEEETSKTHLDGDERDERTHGEETTDEEAKESSEGKKDDHQKRLVGNEIDEHGRPYISVKPATERPRFLSTTELARFLETWIDSSPSQRTRLLEVRQKVRFPVKTFSTGRSTQPTTTETKTLSKDIPASNHPRPIWFKLISYNMDPYRNSMTDKVVLLPGSSSDIADFRDAVKAKCPNLLASFDPAQLEVLKDEDNDDSLASSDSLVGLGKVEGDALLVRVPSC